MTEHDSGVVVLDTPADIKAALPGLREFVAQLGLHAATVASWEELLEHCAEVLANSGCRVVMATRGPRQRPDAPVSPHDVNAFAIVCNKGEPVGLPAIGCRREAFGEAADAQFATVSPKGRAPEIAWNEPVPDAFFHAASASA